MSYSKLISLPNDELTRILFALVLLLAFSHLFGYLFSRFKMPKVIGEIIGGLILGPSCLGFLFPDIYNWVFNAFESEGKLISIIYWLGLVFLMFISGFELQRSYVKEDKKIIIAVMLGSTIMPFLAGWIAPYFYDFTPFIGDKNNMMALKIIIAIAAAVTSIPVISKIFIDLNIIQSRFARIVLTTATVHDIILWIALAIATGLVSSTSVSISNIIITIIITLVFFAVALFIMPKIINNSHDHRLNIFIKSSVTGYTLFICFFFATIACILNVNIVFGALLAGIIVGTFPEEKFRNVKIHIKEISLGFFIPIYFAVVGLKIDIIHNFNILFLLGFLLFISFFETIGTFIAAKIVKTDSLSSLNLSVAMNTRGGPGIVLATVAFDMGIINETFFVALVLIAIITSLLAGIWFKLVLSKGWHLFKGT